MSVRIFALFLAFSVSLPAFAQTAISVPDTASWQHARSQIILPPKLAGLKRSSISDNSSSELDVSVQYESADSIGTVYLYRPYWNDIGVWFDRSEQGLLANKALGNVVAVEDAPTSFARPGGSVASGLYRAYTTSNNKYKATALAIFPVGHWFVKLRYSTSNSDPAIAKAKLMEMIAKVRVPVTASEGTVPQAIPTCTTAITWKKAKVIKPDLAGTFVTGTIFVELMKLRNADFLDLPNACRDGASNERYALYRDANDDNNIVMVAGDSGYSVQVLEALFSNKEYWAIASDLAQHALLPTFTKMPAPDLLFKVVVSGQTVASITDDPDMPSDQKQESVITVPSRK
ncbi:hypothetical protein GGR91_001727 [Sphingorhabdus rigui]|uniref:DUF1254 domain-containing protein n=1 Tax=Sphingorhabdus rigui TaxID=1282858 RepID=A0A840AYH8_9SPHN|nr:hypothetical protein [Sphingorhabdus rigui]MBB3943469.1 hypothetical protein [Sphingorhabdus rigui]